MSVRNVLPSLLASPAPAPAPAQQSTKHVLPLRAPSCHSLGQYRAPVVLDGDDRPVPLVLNHEVDEAVHVLGHFREHERRPERTLQ